MIPIQIDMSDVEKAAKELFIAVGPKRVIGAFAAEMKTTLTSGRAYFTKHGQAIIGLKAKDLKRRITMTAPYGKGEGYLIVLPAHSQVAAARFQIRRVPGGIQLKGVKGYKQQITPGRWIKGKWTKRLVVQKTAGDYKAQHGTANVAEELVKMAPDLIDHMAERHVPRVMKRLEQQLIRAGRRSR